MGGIVIIRQNKKQAKLGIEKAKKILRNKISIGMSIEGQRSEDGSLQQYKKGPIVLALDNHTPVIPIIFKGAYECMPYGEWKIKPGKIKLIYDEKIDTTIYSYYDRGLLIDKLHDIAEKELNIDDKVIK
jgi:1-acyl-sn-glycerol-3-phosphate acyltransferase